jgi:hypothetical protein
MRGIESQAQRAALAAARLGAALAVLMQAQAVLAGVSFIAGDLIGVAPQPEYVVAGDLTGDGLTDIVIVSPAGREVDILVASPDTPSHVAGPHRLSFDTAVRGPALGDLDADGRLDLVVADPSAKAVWVLLGTGDGSFVDPYPVSVPSALHPSSVVISNFDDAGHPDLAIADERLSRVFILRNDDGAPPCFIAGGDFAVGSQPGQIATADFDGNGKPDLVTLNRGGPSVGNVSIALWKEVTQGVAEFAVSLPNPVGEHPGHMVIADFNGDARPDLALLNAAVDARAGEISALLNQGSGEFLPRTITPLGCPFFTAGAPCPLLTLAAGDYDANGRVDLVVGLSDSRRRRDASTRAFDAMAVLGGLGDGQFGLGPVLAIEKAPLSMVSGMITGSGKVDVAVVGGGPPPPPGLVHNSPPPPQPHRPACQHRA